MYFRPSFSYKAGHGKFCRDIPELGDRDLLYFGSGHVDAGRPRFKAHLPAGKLELLLNEILRAFNQSADTGIPGDYARFLNTAFGSAACIISRWRTRSRRRSIKFSFRRTERECLMI